ncbi:MAG: Alkaline phosphatase synthesis sensor protein PhoR [Planctomycetota bacterium]
MSWLRSKLFWKIVGLYVLLSIPAVLGLGATLHTALHRNAAEQHRQTVLGQLQQVAVALSHPDTNQPQFIADFRKTLPAGRTLQLLDQSGHSLESHPTPPVEDFTLRSAINAAATSRSGITHRIVRPVRATREILVACQRINRQPAPAFLLITSDPSASEQQAHETAAVALQATLITWSLGTICLLVVAASVVSPLQVMSRKLQASVRRDDRDDMLLDVSDRSDEVGDVAHALYQLEDQLQDRIVGLEQAGREATASVNLLTAVLDSMIEGVIAIDHQQRIVFLNPGARRLLSIGDGITPGHRLYETVRIPAFLDTVEECLTKNAVNTLEYRNPRDEAHHLLVAIPIQKAPHTGAVVVVRDISDVRRLEAMRRDFVSGVSHELKTPLTVIQACTDTLLAGALEDPSTANHFLKQIEEQSERLLQLILKMLQLARVESGQEILHLENVDAAVIAGNSLRTLRTIADARNIQLVLTGLPQLPLNTDQQALRTILDNLLDNAIKHTPPEGRVTVNLANTPLGPAITVQDTGEGIPESLLDRIFERFYRVERDRSRERGGSGLGLAIVKHLCHALNARIAVRSRLGEGSQFEILFHK